MPCRFVVPRVVRLALSDLEWVDIRAQLTAGEARALFDRIYRRNAHGLMETVPFQLAPATLLAYVLAWNLVDAEGRAVDLAGLDDAGRLATFDALDAPTHTQIYQLIEAHLEREAAARQKSSGPRGSDPT